MDEQRLDTRYIEALIAVATAEPIPDGECGDCHVAIAIDAGAEPTPLCHPCAQSTLSVLAGKLPDIIAALRAAEERATRAEARLREVEAERDRLRGHGDADPVLWRKEVGASGCAVSLARRGVSQGYVAAVRQDGARYVWWVATDGGKTRGEEDSDELGRLAAEKALGWTRPEPRG